MEFWVVNALVRFPPGGQVGSFHSAMFHGEAYREGRPAHRFGSGDAAGTGTYAVENLLRHPLEVVRNAYRVPRICKPIGGWVVAGAARAALGEHPCLHYSLVRFRKLFWVPWEKGVWDERIVRLADEVEWDWYAVYERLEHRPELVERVGPQWELVVYRNFDIRDRFNRGRRVLVPHPAGTNPSEKLSVSEEMLAEYPVFWMRNGMIFRDDYFQRLAPHMEWDYFGAQKLTI